MIKPAIPSNEALRLQTLLEFEVLDTPDEEDFDDLVEMASEICNTPIALVSLIDQERQWFKAKIGVLASETPRDVSFCGHAILQNSVFVVPDSLRDERFNDNPLVTEGPQVRFYAGAPLITSNGTAIGTLCVIDTSPREFTEQQKRFLEVLSKQVVAQLENRKSLRKIQDNFKELQALSQKVLEQQEHLRANERLAVIGQLASGVAHEINNPLAIISGTVMVIKTMIRKGNQDSQIVDQLGRIDSTVNRLAKIGKALKTISTQKAEGFADEDSVEKKFHQLMDEAKAG